MMKQFYLKMDWSSQGIGVALCQLADEDIEVMWQEVQGSACEFDLHVEGKRL